MMMKKRLLCSAAVASLTLGFAMDASAQPSAREIRQVGRAIGIFAESIPTPAVASKGEQGPSVFLDNRRGAPRAIRAAGRAEPGLVQSSITSFTGVKSDALGMISSIAQVRNMGSFDLGTVTLDLPSYGAKPAARGQWIRAATPIAASGLNALGSSLDFATTVLPPLLFGVPAQ